jgi:hypothetical protein
MGGEGIGGAEGAGEGMGGAEGGVACIGWEGGLRMGMG